MGGVEEGYANLQESTKKVSSLLRKKKKCKHVSVEPLQAVPKKGFKGMWRAGSSLGSYTLLPPPTLRSVFWPVSAVLWKNTEEKSFLQINRSLVNK